MHQKKCQTIFLLDSAGICGRPRTLHGVSLHGNSYLDGDRVTFSCDKNLDLFGKAELRCVGRAWDSSEPECKGECSFELMPCKKKTKTNKQTNRNSLINSMSSEILLCFSRSSSVLINLALIQSLVKEFLDNFIRKIEKAKTS